MIQFKKLDILLHEFMEEFIITSYHDPNGRDILFIVHLGSDKCFE